MSVKNLPSTQSFVPDIDIVRREHSFGLEVRLHTLEENHFYPAHTHDSVELNFMERGNVHYLHCNRLQRIAEGQMGVFWAGYPHHIFSADAGVRMWWVTIPFSDFLGWQLPQSLINALIGGHILTDPKSDPLIDSATIRRWEQEQGNSSARPILLLELQARLLRLAANMEKSTRRSMQRDSKNLSFLNPHAVKMASFVTEHFREPLTLGVVAGAAKLNPHYAARLFKQHMGTTVGEFLQEVRIAHAQHKLLNTNAKVIDIAYDSGFQSSSRFYEAFRKVTGASPKTYVAKTPS